MPGLLASSCMHGGGDKSGSGLLARGFLRV